MVGLLVGIEFDVAMTAEANLGLVDNRLGLVVNRNNFV